MTRPDALLARAEALRQDVVSWLQANDPDGDYRDEPGTEPLSLSEGLAMVREAVATGAVAGDHGRFLDGARSASDVLFREMVESAHCWLDDAGIDDDYARAHGPRAARALRDAQRGDA